MQIDPPSQVPQGGGLFLSGFCRGQQLWASACLLLLCSYGHMVGWIQVPSKGFGAAHVKTK